MFCNHCGTKLPDNARFCHNCGNIVSTEGKKPEMPLPQPNQRPKWVIPLIVGTSVMSVLIIVMIIGLFMNMKRDLPSAASSVPESTGSSEQAAPAPTPETSAPTSTPDSEPAEADADVNHLIDQVLTNIEKTPGVILSDDYYQPLVSFTDIDGNGAHELLVLYKKNTSNGCDALYDVYTVQDGTLTEVATEQFLYTEVGGNSGILELVVDKAKKPYLRVEQNNPHGDGFNNYITYLPWNGSQSAFEDYWVYMEAHGVYGEEDKAQYILGDTKVSREEFEARETEFMSLWTELDLNKGPGNGGNCMSFSQIRQTDMNTYTFPSA